MSQPGAILSIIGLCAVTAVICHWLIRGYVVASLWAAVIGDILLQIASYIEIGYLNPFFPIALITGGCIALGITLLVGVPFAVVRRRKRGDHVA